MKDVKLNDWKQLKMKAYAKAMGKTMTFITTNTKRSDYCA